jgi:hypothetical protein
MTQPGEQLIWSGRPHPARYAFRKGGPSFGLGLSIVGFTLYWLQTAWQADVQFALLGSPFLLAGLALLVAPFWHLYRATRATYALTDRQAVIDIAGPFPHRLAMPLGEIRFVERHPGMGDVGDVLFREFTGRARRRDGFVAVARADHVEQLLRRTIAQCTGQRQAAA